MRYADWAGVTHDLVSSLESLRDGDFLIMGEPSARATPRRDLFGRAPTPAPTRYVQALRVEQVLSAECVGATSLGGTWDMPDVTIRQLCEMGWLTPVESSAAYGDETPNFEVYVERTSTRGLADLMVASLALLGAQPHALLLESPESLDAVGG